jgi:hypothetical protein
MWQNLQCPDGRADTVNMNRRLLVIRIIVGTVLPGLAVLGARMAWSRLGPTPSATQLIAKSNAWAQSLGGLEIRSASSGLEAMNRGEVMKATGTVAFKDGRYLYWTERTYLDTRSERDNYGDERGTWERQPQGCWAYSYEVHPWSEFTFRGQLVPPLNNVTMQRHGSRIELRGTRPDGHAMRYEMDRAGRVYNYTYEVDESPRAEVTVTVTKSFATQPQIPMPQPNC